MTVYLAVNKHTGGAAAFCDRDSAHHFVRQNRGWTFAHYDSGSSNACPQPVLSWDKKSQQLSISDN